MSKSKSKHPTIAGHRPPQLLKGATLAGAAALGQPVAAKAAPMAPEPAKARVRVQADRRRDAAAIRIRDTDDQRRRLHVSGLRRSTSTPGDDCASSFRGLHEAVITTPTTPSRDPHAARDIGSHAQG